MFSKLHNEEIITLTAANGEDIDFKIIASVELMLGSYLIAQPVKLLDGMAKDEALVFQKKVKFGGVNYEIVMDDRTIDKVFDKYNKMLNRRY